MIRSDFQATWLVRKALCSRICIVCYLAYNKGSYKVYAHLWEKNTGHVSHRLMRLVMYETEHVQTGDGGKGMKGSDASLKIVFVF